jgi:hypothetical protein
MKVCCTMLHNRSWGGGGVGTLCASVHFQKVHISHYVMCESVLFVSSRWAEVLYHWQVTRSTTYPANFNIWIEQGQQMLSQMQNVQKEEGIIFLYGMRLNYLYLWTRKDTVKQYCFACCVASLHASYLHRNYFALCYIKYELELNKSEGL